MLFVSTGCGVPLRGGLGPLRFCESRSKYFRGIRDTFLIDVKSGVQFSSQQDDLCVFLFYYHTRVNYLQRRASGQLRSLTGPIYPRSYLYCQLPIKPFYFKP